MSASQADQLLVARIREGDSTAWEYLIERFEGRLLAFVRSRLKNRSAAEDIVQETFLGFLVSLPNYRETTPLESFLFSIAAHKLTDYLRKEGRRPKIPLFIADEQGRAEEPVGRSRVASSLARSQERRQRESHVISACLRNLISRWFDQGEFERLQCVELLFVRGWANKAAAEHLRITEQAVANHKQFVVAKLKEAGAKAHIGEIPWQEFGVDA